MSDPAGYPASVLHAQDLDTCVRCGLCLSSCPTFRLTGMEGYSPRGRIKAARSLTDGGKPDPVVADYLDTCLGCRACEAVCPSGVPYGRILEGARAALPPQGGPARRLGERILLWAVSRRWRLSVLSLPLYIAQKLGVLDLFAGLSRRGLLPGGLDTLGGLPRLKLRDLLIRVNTNYVPPDGVERRGQVVLFAGCVQDAWARDVHWATIHVLTRLGYRVRIPYGQVCCGALHAHAGRTAAARRLAERNIEPLERFEGEIVVSSSGCGAKLKEYGEVIDHRDVHAVAGRVRDLAEIITPEDLRAAGASAPEGLRRIAMHDPCHLVYGQRIKGEPRALLEAAGYEVVDLPDEGRCCGAAGTFAAHHPDWAQPLRADKLDACREVGADAVCVGNPGCLFWMQAAPDAPAMYHAAQLVALALLEV